MEQIVDSHKKINQTNLPKQNMSSYFLPYFNNHVKLKRYTYVEKKQHI